MQMDSDEAPRAPLNSERRTGRERRRPGSSDPARRQIQVLLARLIALFIGALVGFLVSYFISWAFILPLQVLARDAQEIVDNARTELADVEPAFVKARKEYNALEEQLFSEDASGGGDETSPAPSPEPQPVPETPPADDEAVSAAAAELPASESNGLELDAAVFASAGQHATEIRETYLRLKRQRQRLVDQRDFWEQELVEYQRSIDLLNLLGIAVVLVFALLGYLAYPLVLMGLRRLSGQLDVFSAGLEQRTVQATIGFFAGLVLGVVIVLAVFNAFSADYSFLGISWFRLLFGAFVVVVLGLAGSLVGITYFGPPRMDDPYKPLRRNAAPKILDTSVLIDGRIPDVATTGFLGGMLIVTNSVLRELQSMADSADERKRVKGRRGLELVRTMQDDSRLDVDVFDDSAFESHAQSTDEQLIIVAQAMGGMVVTNDYNLNRVAAIRDVRVININALANAVKTKHLPGDLIDIEIIDHGKQKGQGIGYLEDGTMVVIEDGEPHIGKSRTVKLTSVSQTVQGRLLFGRVDLAREEQRGNG
jgi:uncharacterized protein YacL